MRTVLVTGATGQIGSELTPELCRLCGPENVVATSRRSPGPEKAIGECRFEILDVTDRTAVERALARSRVDTVFHLAAVLSASGERDPIRAWTVNLDGLRNVLDAARASHVEKVFWPSSIAVFGPDSPRDRTPQSTVMRPTTMYGVSKVSGELICDYYTRKLELDVRSVRYPGVVSSETLPGGGTTDYAVEMFHAALRCEPYRCFVRPDTVLPMIYMPDCIRAALELMGAERAGLCQPNAYNLAAMTFSAEELADEIRKHLPGFTCTYEPDYRQAIADSWPRSVDDSAAREEWRWQSRYDLPEMTADMLLRLKHRQQADSA